MSKSIFYLLQDGFSFIKLSCWINGDPCLERHVCACTLYMHLCLLAMHVHLCAFNMIQPRIVYIDMHTKAKDQPA